VFIPSPSEVADGVSGKNKHSFLKRTKTTKEYIE